MHRTGAIRRKGYCRRFARIEIFGKAANVPFSFLVLYDPVVLFEVLFVECVDVFEYVIAASWTDSILFSQRKSADRTLFINVLLQSWYGLEGLNEGYVPLK
jgi:hypothetical protein